MVGVRVSASTEPEVPSAPVLAAGFEGSSATEAAVEGATAGAGWSMVGPAGGTSGLVILDDSEAVGLSDSGGGHHGCLHRFPLQNFHLLQSPVCGCNGLALKIERFLLMPFDLTCFDF